MARCAVRAACCGATVGLTGAAFFILFRPLDAGGDIAARSPYQADASTGACKRAEAAGNSFS